MAGLMRKGMSWLGLGPEEDYERYDDRDEDRYEDYDDDFGPEDELEQRPERRRPARQAATVPSVGVAPLEEAPTESPAIRVLPPAGAGETGNRAQVQRVAAPATARPHVVTPTSFNDAQEVGDHFKRRTPVIINLQGLDRDLARRLLDFSSGVTYGLGGRVERVASHVYLLSPADVEVSPEDRRKITEALAD